MRRRPARAPVFSGRRAPPQRGPGPPGEVWARERTVCRRTRRRSARWLSVRRRGGGRGGRGRGGSRRGGHGRDRRLACGRHRSTRRRSVRRRTDLSARVREHAGDHELELKSRGGGAGHLVERGDHDVGRARKAQGAVRVGLTQHPGEVLGGDTAQNGGGPLTGRRGDDEITQSLEQVVHEAPGVLPRLHDAVDGGEGRRRIARAESVHHFVEQFGVRVAQKGHRARVRHDRALRAGDQLVEQ